MGTTLVSAGGDGRADTRTSASPSGGSRSHRRSRLLRILLSWATVWLAAAGLHLARDLLLDRPPDPWRALTTDLPVLAVWCLATPLVLAIGRRWPLRPALDRLGFHVLSGVGFVAASNLLIRVPVLLTEGAAPWLRSSSVAFLDYLPPALVLYLGIAWLGGRRPADGDRGAADDGRADGFRAGLAADPDHPAGVDARRDPEVPGRIDDGESGGGPLALEGSLRTYLLRPEEIVWIEADNNHVRVHLNDGGRIRIRERLSALEERLRERGFLRIHRSTLLRIDAVREVQPLGKGDLAVVLRDGTDLRVSRSRKEALESALGLDT